MKRIALIQAIGILVCLAAYDAVGDGVNRKLYVPHSEGTGVSIIDAATQKIIGEIEVGKRPHGVAASKAQDLLYVSIEDEGSMVAIDTRTDKIVKRYESLGSHPNEIAITSDGRLIYIPVMGDGVFRVFDTQKEQVIAEIPTKGGPHNSVVSPDDRYAFLAPMDRGDLPEKAVAARGFPTTLNQLIYIVDTRTQNTVATVDVGDAPRPIAINPNGKYLYSNTDGLQGFVVIDVEKHEVVARVKYSLTERERAKPSRTHGIWVTPDGKEVWTCDVNNGVAYAFDATKNPPVELARVETGAPLYWLEGTPDGKTLYAAGAPTNVVSAIDIASRKVIAVIQMPEGSSPKRMLVVDVPRN